MKRLIYLIPVLFLLSCSKGMVTFTVKDSVETTIENIFPISIPFNIPIPAITTTATQEFENNKTTPELVQDVVVKDLQISLLDSNDDFSMIKSLHIFIKKVDDSDRIEVAYLDNIDSNSNVISLDFLETNLVEYLREESYKIDVEVTLKEIVAHNIAIKIDMEFKVTADLIR